ncbi:exonuclease domain-containing protein [Flavobacterium sp.]|uniref:3'-5' exonuclease n=1 Tax=Flavobacterium sp. TaxID=239 RepID=UPI002627AAF3|nr:exonuclease domain-containing protein [Flavobacterium sp.]
MLDWLKNINKEHPEFWKKYLSKFDKKPSRYIALSVDTTGLNPKKDVILSLGSIGIEKDTIHIGDVFEVTIPQYKFLHDNNLSNDFLLESEQPKLSEVQAIEKLIDFIGNATLVGHRINFDVEMINEALEKLSCGRLKNEALDIEVMYKKLHDINDKNFSLDELSHIFKISKTERISTTDDAYTIALLFLKLKSRLGL